MKLDPDIKQSADITRSSYDKMAKHWHDLHSRSFMDREFAIFLQYLPKGQIIDIGCGPGKDAHFFLQHTYEYLGIDNSLEMIKIAQQNEPKARFEVRSFYDLDYRGATFDGFWANTSLLHVPKHQIRAMLGEIGRITKVSGVGFICLKPRGEKGLVEDGLVEEERYGDSFTRYFALYSLKEFSQILHECGFAILKTYVKHKVGKNWLCYFVKNVG